MPLKKTTNKEKDSSKDITYVAKVIIKTATVETKLNIINN